MNVTCPDCGATYFVDEKKIPKRGGRLTCATCGKRWDIFRQATGEVGAVSAAGSAAAAPQPPISGGVVAAADATSPMNRGPVPAPPVDTRVTCPKCGHAFLPDSRPRAAAGGPGRRVILLVEDQKYFTELTREALGQEFRTVSVSTKDEALKVIEADPPSLMILDLSLARNQDGRELLRAIPAKTFPILIFTARDETELYGEAWEELKELGADDIVHKGMNVGDELRRKVASLLERR